MLLYVPWSSSRSMVLIVEWIQCLGHENMKYGVDQVKTTESLRSVECSWRSSSVHALNTHILFVSSIDHGRLYRPWSLWRSIILPVQLHDSSVLLWEGLFLDTLFELIRSFFYFLSYWILNNERVYVILTL